MNNLQGIDLADFQHVELNKQAFAKADLQLYTSLRAHFLVHAVQSGSKLPSEASMLRSERRNAKKSKKDDEEKEGLGVRGGRMPVGRAMLKMKFRVPNRYGAKLPKNRRRGRGGRRPIMLSSHIPMGFPLMPSFGAPMPMGSIGMPPMRPMGMLPGMLPGMSLGLPPMSMPGVGFPPMIPMMPPSSASISVPSFAFPPMTVHSGPSVPPATIPTMPIRKKRANKPACSNAFKVQSPEQIVLKCARQAARAQLETLRKKVEPEIVEQVNEQIPLYFRKKKASQKRRREEKHELIKKNRKRLYEIYGQAIFSRGWPISRKEILQALEIKQETETNLQGLSELMQENNEPKQESSCTKEQPEQEVKLFLLLENTEQLEVQCSVAV